IATTRYSPTREPVPPPAWHSADHETAGVERPNRRSVDQVGRPRPLPAGLLDRLPGRGRRAADADPNATRETAWPAATEPAVPPGASALRPAATRARRVRRRARASSRTSARVAAEAQRRAPLALPAAAVAIRPAPHR